MYRYYDEEGGRIVTITAKPKLTTSTRIMER